MLGRFARAEKNDRDVVVVAGAQLGVFVDVDFGEAGAEFLQEGRDLLLGLFAEVAARTRINGDVARAGQLQSAVFRAGIAVRRFDGAQPASLKKLQDGGFCFRRISQILQRPFTRIRAIENGQNFLLKRIHRNNYL